MYLYVLKWLTAALNVSASSRRDAPRRALAALPGRHPPWQVPTIELCTRLFAIVTLLGISMTPAARADVVTFAQFNQQMVSDQDFTYTNKGTSAGFDALGQGIRIYLSVTEGFAPSLQRVESARLFLTSSTSAAVMLQAPPDTLAREHFTGLANTIQVVLDRPVDGKRNFLTVTFSDGLLSGRLHAEEASLKTSDADSGNPSRVSYSSDFIDFTGAIEHGFSLSFSSVNSTAGGGYLQMADNGFFRSFTASGTGTFDSNFAAPVPEPSSLVLAGFGLLGLLSLASMCKSTRGT